MQLTNPEVRIETTNYCNTHCLTCPRDKMTRPKMTMEYKHFCNLVVQAYELGATTISPFGYGEPLMDKGLEKKIAFCSRMGLKTFITTNAAMLTLDRTRAILDAGLSHIRFSAHGIFDNYERVHQLDWYMFQRNVWNFIKVKRGIPIHVDITAIPMHDDMDEIINYWEGKVDGIAIWKPHGWGGKKQYRKSREKIPTCGRPQRGPVQIQADGTVIPCCFLTDSEIVLGDTHKNTIEEILKGDAYKELRRKHMEGNLKGLVCQYCDQRLLLDESPLLYSSNGTGINQTSSTKFNLLEEQNGININ
ncbi:MAG: radical SAM/SPASM domain-containing protein [Candidatus Hodarchaeota archaeon]